eukprot:1559961-Rhodomonas_salina.2
MRIREERVGAKHTNASCCSRAKSRHKGGQNGGVLQAEGARVGERGRSSLTGMTNAGSYPSSAIPPLRASTGRLEPYRGRHCDHETLDYVHNFGKARPRTLCIYQPRGEDLRGSRGYIIMVECVGGMTSPHHRHEDRHLQRKRRHACHLRCG